MYLVEACSRGEEVHGGLLREDGMLTTWWVTRIQCQSWTFEGSIYSQRSVAHWVIMECHTRWNRVEKQVRDILAAEEPVKYYDAGELMKILGWRASVNTRLKSWWSWHKVGTSMTLYDLGDAQEGRRRPMMAELPIFSLGWLSGFSLVTIDIKWYLSDYHLRGRCRSMMT